MNFRMEFDSSIGPTCLVPFCCDMRIKVNSYGRGGEEFDKIGWGSIEVVHAELKLIQPLKDNIPQP